MRKNQQLATKKREKKRYFEDILHMHKSQTDVQNIFQPQVKTFEITIFRSEPPQYKVSK